MPALPLLGRVAVVSGANHGIGAATAAELARLGADVAVTLENYTMRASIELAARLVTGNLVRLR